MESEQVKTYRSVVAKANCLSQDRPDIKYAIKELCRHMSAPTEADWSDLKRLSRYLKSRPRMIQHRLKPNPQQELIEVMVDSDWAGCPRP